MPVRVVELFAGVGGFRLGLEDADQRFKTTFFNQFEPGSKVQHAWNCYVEHFLPDDLVSPLTNEDIAKVPNKAIPTHDLLVGGFPCQDYSVATTLDKAGGIQGKKGILWWEINRIVSHHKPPYLLLENVDRLLKSPASQRGRDFAIVLACLRDQGYNVEWRVLNAADYGAAQRRRRVFIFAALQNTGIGRFMASNRADPGYLQNTGFFAEEFPTSFEVLEETPSFILPDGVRTISDSYDAQFQAAGLMVKGEVWTRRVTPKTDPQATLGQHLERGAVDETLFVDPARVTGPKGWRHVKGAKREPRTAKNGHVYNYTEGAMQFPDLHEFPARTILTSEGNATPNRSTHVVEDPLTRRLRLLTPLEVERLMGFRDNWTENLPRRWRFFTMGNALVVPLVTRMGRRLVSWIVREEPEGRKKRLLDGQIEVEAPVAKAKAKARKATASKR